LNWKEPSEIENPLDRVVGQLLQKGRLLEIIHDFIVFDAGVKKICRHNQYFGVKAAQERVKRREGGIIWHTQGSGKSLTMIWLAKWIREHVKNSRVLILTDRTELDGQIEKFFLGVDEAIYRTKSGADLVSVLSRNDEWLMCSLIHKFGTSEEGDVDAFVREIEGNLSKGFQPKGETLGGEVIFVCVRTDPWCGRPNLNISECKGEGTQSEVCLPLPTDVFRM
jgi:type I restriction enzyme R subunit